MQQAYRYVTMGHVPNDEFWGYLSYLSNAPVIEPLQQIRVRHPIKQNDSLVSLLFPNSKITFYQTVNIGRLRLCTRAYCENETADDSNILFKSNDSEYPGRIRSIFTIDDGQPYLLVAYLSNYSPSRCKINENEFFDYPYMQHGSSKDWFFIPITTADFVEKLVFFDDRKGMCYFFRFPTLEHCSWFLW